MRTRRAFTILEVLIAIAILGIVLGAINVVVLSSIRQNASAGERTQAALIMNYFGRRVAGGEAGDLGGVSWGYGTLVDGLPDLTAEEGFSDPDLYRVDLTVGDELAIGGTSMWHYAIEVCWRVADEESCITGDTAGPPPGVDTPEALPGIN